MSPACLSALCSSQSPGRDVSGSGGGSSTPSLYLCGSGEGGQRTACSVERITRESLALVKFRSALHPGNSLQGRERRLAVEGWAAPGDLRRWSPARRCCEDLSAWKLKCLQECYHHDCKIPRWYPSSSKCKQLFKSSGHNIYFCHILAL